MKLGPLCAFLWRILTWCAMKQVTQSSTHPWLAECDSRQTRLGQTIQTEWSLLPEIFATRFNNKLPQFVSPIPDPQAWAVEALSLSWEDLDLYAFPPVAILGKVVEKLPVQQNNSDCPMVAQHAQVLGLGDNAQPDPFMSAQSAQPCFLTQPFNQTIHRNLLNLNLHAWLLEPQLSRSKASMKQ